MLRLITFGGVALTRDGIPIGAAGGWRRLALLSLLAAYGDRGVARDTLAALLWPTSDVDAARHSLHQALHMARKSLGPDAIAAGSTMVRLEAAYVDTDVRAFETAIRGRQLEQAVGVYRGAFADGLSLRDAPELEQRIAGLRVGYGREYLGALETLARTAAERGDHLASVRWWQRAADADPLSARIAKHLLSALVSADEPARALQFALVHAALMQQDGTPVDAEITHWIQRLRGSASVGASVRAAGGNGLATAAGDADLRSIEHRQMARLSGAMGRRYRVGQLAEDGSIVATYPATATDGGSDVSVHVVQPRVASMAGARDFLESLGRAARLADRHILQVLDAGATDDLLFFVTARRSRPSLRERLRRDRALPIRDALGIGRGIAAALGHAHRRGVHHGDLRPKHVGLAGGEAVVAGFGVIEGVSGTADWSSRSTVVALGSPAYLSPEQLSGAVRADARSDVYAFGCILYEMLTGDPPFGRRSSAAALGHKLGEPAPPVRRFRESVPEALELIVQACLSRIPADRYADGEDVARALATVAVSV